MILSGPDGFCGTYSEHGHVWCSNFAKQDTK
jgi:hypothetical protein